MTFVPEEVDLVALRTRLRDRFGDLGPAGYVRGKTDLRSAVVQLLACSNIEAERIVDTLETRRLIRYEGDTNEGIDDLESFWQLDPV